MPKSLYEQLKAKKPLFKTSAEARAYYKGRLKELSERSGMDVPSLLEWAEHTDRDSYVSRQARKFRNLIDALSEPVKAEKKRDEVWMLRIEYDGESPVEAHTSTTLYRDPMEADAAGKKALEEDEFARFYSVNVCEVK
jgi:hypothetical protein